MAASGFRLSPLGAPTITEAARQSIACSGAWIARVPRLGLRLAIRRVSALTKKLARQV